MEQEEEEGKADRVQLLLDMFDSYWFHHLILLQTTSPFASPSSPATISLETDPVEFLLPTAEAEAQEEKVARRPRLTSLRRSLSEEVPAISASPPLAFPKRQHYRANRKLRTILSGKKHHPDAEEEQRGPHEEENNNRGSLRRKGGEKSRSLSELEFEELKGFMDLGFTFSEEEAADPKLVSIVPGLQRLGKKKEAAAEVEEEPSVARPYLSEAWAAEEARREREMRRRRRRQREEEHALRNWRIPAAGDGDDLKNHIRHWAHTVASTVR